MPADEIRIAGELVLSENEGGFSAPSIEVDGINIDRLILGWLDELPAHDRGGNLRGDVVRLGRFIITVKRFTR